MIFITRMWMNVIYITDLLELTRTEDNSVSKKPHKCLKINF